MTIIDEFKDKYAFLSNFYDSEFYISGVKYPTVEHYFQAAKATDIDEALPIVFAATPGIAKKMGRKVFIRKDWEQVKDEVMLKGVRKKFENVVLRQKLLNTRGSYLIEGNYWHDNYWGSCKCSKCGDKGENHLGKILMKVREECSEIEL